MSSFLPLGYSEVKLKKLFCHRRFAAIGANIIRRSGIAADKRISNSCGSAELNGNGHTNILRDGKNTGTVPLPITSHLSGYHHGGSAAFVIHLNELDADEVDFLLTLISRQEENIDLLVRAVHEK